MNARLTLEIARDRALAEALASPARPVLMREGAEAPPAVLAPHVDRIEAVPVSDRAVTAMAVGMALGGQAVILELSTRGRLLALMEVLQEAGSLSPEWWRRSLVILAPWGTEAGALDGQVLGALLGLHGVRVVVASSPGGVAGLLVGAVESSGVTLLGVPRRLAPGPEHQPVGWGSVHEVAVGGAVTLAAVGGHVEVALAAADELREQGVDAGVLDLVGLHPLDGSGLGAVVQRTGRLVVLAEPSDEGWVDAVRAAVMRHAFYYLECPVRSARPEVEAVVRAVHAQRRD